MCRTQDTAGQQVKGKKKKKQTKKYHRISMYGVRPPQNSQTSLSAARHRFLKNSTGGILCRNSLIQCLDDGGEEHCLTCLSKTNRCSAGLRPRDCEGKMNVINFILNTSFSEPSYSYLFIQPFLSFVNCLYAYSWLGHFNNSYIFSLNSSR